MQGWVGPVAALSLAVIALSVLLVMTMAIAALRQAQQHARSLAHELQQLRADIGPTLAAVNRLSEQGADVARMVQDEAREIVETSRRIRHDVERVVERAKG